jgi:hypothetical protein
MAKKLKTNGIYGATCVVTGEPAGTTPAVFAKRAGSYGVTVQVLKENYIGRTGAKLLRTLVTEKGQKPVDAIKAIRAQFEVKLTTPVADAIVNKIVSKVSAKAKKAAATADFKAKKDKALAALLGTKEATPAATKPTEPAKSEKPAGK